MVSTEGSAQEQNDMGAGCVSCEGRRFRRSRLQWKDLRTLLSLHYPVRCLSCSKRQVVSFPVARRSLSSSVKQVRAPQHDGTPWSTPIAVTAQAVDPSVGKLELPQRAPVSMPDLHNVKLPHLAYVPPGDGENLVP